MKRILNLRKNSEFIHFGLIQLGVLATAVVVVAFAFGLQLAASFCIGAGAMWVNYLVIGWTSWRTLAKKSIAWTTAIIVIKYAVLLGTLFFVVRRPWFSVLAAGIGIGSFVFSALLGAVLMNQKVND